MAALFALADEVSLDIDVLARWRQSEAFAASHPEGGDHENVSPDEPPPVVDPLIAELTDLLRPPRKAPLPVLPELTAPAAAGIPDRLVADVLDDALAHLRVRWD